MLVVDGAEVLDVREAADYVDRTPETVRRWVWSGRLPAVRSGNRLLVRRADLDALTGTRHAMPTLAEWAARLPQPQGSAAGSGTAADLVLEDRERRARR